MPDLSLALEKVDVSLGDLRRTAEQVILFGSRAAGLAQPDSDFDILVVGEGHSRNTPAIDLLWVSPRDLASRAWLGSELAGHVARWGSWLHGDPDWVADVVLDDQAREHKARRLASRLAALERTWELLGTGHRRVQRVLLRRDLQRHDFLAQGKAVPPNALLDRAWLSCEEPAEELRRLAGAARVGSPFFETCIVMEATAASQAARGVR